ncbi:MAG: GatB/YqeY domain-containing protein [Candidatus Scalindua sp.]|nr:GatB/YqeY domain-containing protein [Candidatus Scalindua sp.]MDV5165151.1 GatB/YqeY domain-containing protein [Candidatus Scalindua sp.]
MMKERIADEIKNAMKSGDKLRVSVLRMLQADIINVEKSGKEFKQIDVIRGYAKKLKKAIEEYERLNLQDKIISFNEELKIVEEFLPKQMSDEELKKVVIELLDSEKPADMGMAMKLVMGKYKEVADGKKVQALVKEVFSKG